MFSETCCHHLSLFSSSSLLSYSSTTHFSAKWPIFPICSGCCEPQQCKNNARMQMMQKEKHLLALWTCQMQKNVPVWRTGHNCHSGCGEKKMCVMGKMNTSMLFLINDFERSPGLKFSLSLTGNGHQMKQTGGQTKQDHAHNQSNAWTHQFLLILSLPSTPKIDSEDIKYMTNTYGKENKWIPKKKKR